MIQFWIITTHGILRWKRYFRFSHTGIAIRLADGRIHLLHAPNVGKKVQISDVPLADYIKGIKNQTGIIVSRPVSPN